MIWGYISYSCDAAAAVGAVKEMVVKKFARKSEMPNIPMVKKLGRSGRAFLKKKSAIIMPEEKMLSNASKTVSSNLKDSSFLKGLIYFVIINLTQHSIKIFVLLCCIMKMWKPDKTNIIFCPQLNVNSKLLSSLHL